MIVQRTAGVKQHASEEEFLRKRPHHGAFASRKSGYPDGSGYNRFPAYAAPICGVFLYVSTLKAVSFSYSWHPIAEHDAQACIWSRAGLQAGQAIDQETGRRRGD